MRLAMTTYLVREYDEAIAWFTGALCFELIEDAPLGDGKRWVVVAAPGGGRLLLARAANAEQRECIGKVAGGRVAYFLETDDFAASHAAMVREGVRFLQAPRREAYGVVCVFVDLYGNKWDLIEPA